MRTNSPIMTISRKELRSLTQVEVKPSVDAARQEEMRSMSRSLVEKTICGVFATGFCAATEGIENSFLSFVENVITEMTYCGVPDKTLGQSFNCWSRSDTLMHVLVEKSTYDPGFLTPVAAFVTKCVINAVDEKLKQEPQVTKKISSPTNRSSSATIGVASDVKFSASRCHRKRQNQKM